MASLRGAGGVPHVLSSLILPTLSGVRVASAQLGPKRPGDLALKDETPCSGLAGRQGGLCREKLVGQPSWSPPKPRSAPSSI